MTKRQGTFEDFGSEGSSNTSSEDVESNGIEERFDDGEDSTPSDNNEIRDDPVLRSEKSASTGSDLRFGKDPHEFDIPCKWARRYLAHRCANSLENKSLSESTLPGYESDLREYVNFVHEHNETVCSADFELFREYVLFCVDIGRRTGTITSKVSIIKSLYKHITLKEKTDAAISPLEFEQIERSAIEDMTPSDIQREDLTRDELKKLFNAIENERDRLMAIVGAETGFRNSDIRGIRLNDIDFDEPEVFAHDPKNNKPYTVPISEDLAFELEIWIETGREAQYGHLDSEYLFPSERGSMIKNGCSLANIIREAAEEAGIQGVLGTTKYESEYLKEPKVDRTWYQVIPHVLRHSFITILEKEGVSLEYRRLLANHSSTETTRQYSHGKKEILKKAQRRVDLPY